MNRLGHTPANSTLPSVSIPTVQAPPHLCSPLELTSRCHDFPIPPSADLAANYPLPIEASFDGRHLADLPRFPTESQESYAEAPTSHVFNEAYKHSLPDHDFKRRRPSSASVISSGNTRQDDAGGCALNCEFNCYSQPRESGYSSDFSGAEFDNRSSRKFFYQPDSDLVPEDNEPLTRKDGALFHLGTYSYPHEAFGASVNECYQGYAFTQKPRHERLENDFGDEKSFEEASTICPSRRSKADSEKILNARVSEKRRQQNRAAQRAMRERRKQAAQHQEIHMSAIVAENAYLREKVAYLSSLLANQAIAQSGHVHQWNSYDKKFPVLTALNTANLHHPSLPESSPQNGTSVPPASMFTVHGKENRACPPTPNSTLNELPASPHKFLDTVYSSGIGLGRKPGTLSAPTFSHSGMADGAPIYGSRNFSSSWHEMAEASSFCRGNSPLVSRSGYLALNIHKNDGNSYPHTESNSD